MQGIGQNTIERRVDLYCKLTRGSFSVEKEGLLFHQLYLKSVMF